MVALRFVILMNTVASYWREIKTFTFFIFTLHEINWRTNNKPNSGYWYISKNTEAEAQHTLSWIEMHRQNINAYAVYRSPIMVNKITQRATVDKWYPVPIRLVNNRRCDAGLNTSPWTCFQPYSSPRSLS